MEYAYDMKVLGSGTITSRLNEKAFIKNIQVQMKSMSSRNFTPQISE